MSLIGDMIMKIETRADVVAIVEDYLSSGQVSPNSAALKAEDWIKTNFNLVNPRKGLYWKETPNGVLSVSIQGSCAFLPAVGDIQILFEFPAEDGRLFKFPLSCLYMYARIGNLKEPWFIRFLDSVVK